MRLVWLEYYLLSRPILWAVMELRVAWSHYHQKHRMREKASMSWKGSWPDHHNAWQGLRFSPNL